jgi:hypothetical protein
MFEKHTKVYAVQLDDDGLQHGECSVQTRTPASYKLGRMMSSTQPRTLCPFLPLVGLSAPEENVFKCLPYGNDDEK